MEIFSTLVAVVFSMAVSLGVGSSTLAILNFFVAIRDGIIDPTERKMMGTVYIALRVAMVILFFTLTLLTAFASSQQGLAALTAFLFAQWTVLSVLYANAILMTAKIMPSRFGPSIQAGSWYTLGILSALAGVGYHTFSYGLFIVGYVSLVVLATIVVQSVMRALTAKPTTNPA